MLDESSDDAEILSFSSSSLQIRIFKVDIPGMDAVLERGESWVYVRSTACSTASPDRRKLASFDIPGTVDVAYPAMFEDVDRGG